MLETNDLKGTLDFYTNVLGFTCTSSDESSGWIHLTKDTLSLMFSIPNKNVNPGGKIALSGSLYFNVENADVVWQKVAPMCKACYPPDNFEYGMREFAVYDNNGYLLQFGHEIG